MSSSLTPQSSRIPNYTCASFFKQLPSGNLVKLQQKYKNLASDSQTDQCELKGVEPFV